MPANSGFKMVVCVKLSELVAPLRVIQAFEYEWTTFKTHRLSFVPSLLWYAVDQMYEESGWLQETNLSELYRSLNRYSHHSCYDFDF